MSVINKMLRDLDQRQTASNGQGAGKPLARDQVMRGTQALVLPSGKARTHAWPWVALVAVGLLLGGVAWWVTSSHPTPVANAVEHTLAPAAVAPIVSPPAQTASAPAPAVVATFAASPVSASVATTKPATPVPVIHASTPTPMKPVATEPAKLASPMVDNASAKMTSSPVRSELRPKAVSATVIGAAALPPAAPAKLTADGFPQGANQALAQAQAMWNEGARASAIDLLQQAVGRVETAAGGSAAPATLATLVRELVRMELAEAQVNNALKLLVRLEPQIAQVPDLWAMRGNAAQRLGQHTEAASSYQHALNLKPSESRWMLGLAVSLAAQGQTAQAGDLAEKVRLQGALRPEIANYLRQLGVVIHAD